MITVRVNGATLAPLKVSVRPDGLELRVMFTVRGSSRTILVFVSPENRSP